MFANPTQKKKAEMECLVSVRKPEHRMLRLVGRCRGEASEAAKLPRVD